MQQNLLQICSDKPKLAVVFGLFVALMIVDWSKMNDRFHGNKITWGDSG